MNEECGSVADLRERFAKKFCSRRDPDKSEAKLSHLTQQDRHATRNATATTIADDGQTDETCVFRQITTHITVIIIVHRSSPVPLYLSFLQTCLLVEVGSLYSYILLKKKRKKVRDKEDHYIHTWSTPCTQELLFPFCDLASFWLTTRRRRCRHFIFVVATATTTTTTTLAVVNKVDLLT